MYNRTAVPAEFSAQATHNHGGATDKQLAFIGSLLGEMADQDLMQRAAARYGTLCANGELTTRKASEMITWLLDQPKAARQAPAPQATSQAPQVDVPAGRYAVDTEDGHLAFYRVDRPTEGKWAGYTFVKVQASDEYHRVPRNAQAAILAKIAQDPQAAMLRYGQELGSCGHCGRTLTNEDSRERGIGPVCAGKMGW